jgi:hypothetical protein
MKDEATIEKLDPQQQNRVEELEADLRYHQ